MRKPRAEGDRSVQGAPEQKPQWGGNADLPLLPLTNVLMLQEGGGQTQHPTNCSAVCEPQEVVWGGRSPTSVLGDR